MKKERENAAEGGDGMKCVESECEESVVMKE